MTVLFLFGLVFANVVMCKVAIGIDFGFSSRVSVIAPRRPIHFVLDELSDSDIPSAIGFLDGNTFFGELATRLSNKPLAKIYSLPGLISEAKNPWEHLVPTGNGNSKDLLSVSAAYFHYLNGLCNEHFKKELDGLVRTEASVVISVSTELSYEQIQFIKTSASIAGFSDPKVVHSGLALATQYASILSRFPKANSTVVFADVGHRNVCFSLANYGLKNGTGVVSFLGQKCSAILSGQMVDNACIKLIHESTSQPGTELSDERSRAILPFARNLKMKLTSNDDYMMAIDDDPSSQSGAVKYSRQRLNEILKSTAHEISEVLGDEIQKLFGFSWDKVDGLVLVGGSSRVPHVQDILKSNIKDTKILFNLNDNESVATGSARYAALLLSKAKPFDVQMLTNDAVVMTFKQEGSDAEPEQRRLLNKGDYLPVKQLVQLGLKGRHTLNILLDDNVIDGFELDASAETQCTLEFEGIGEKQYTSNISCGLQAAIKPLQLAKTDRQPQIERAREWCKKLGEHRDDQKKLSKVRNDLDAFYYWSESPETDSFVALSCSEDVKTGLHSAKTLCMQLMERFGDYSVDHLVGHVAAFEKIRSDINARLDKRKELDEHFYDAEIDASRGVYLPEAQELLSKMVAAYKAKDPKDVSFDSEIQGFLEWRKSALESKKQHDSQSASKKAEAATSQTTESSLGPETSPDNQPTTPPAHEEL